MRRALAALALALFTCTAAAEVAVPPLNARVIDLTGTLSAEQRGAIERKLAALETAKGSQIAVLVLPTTQPETIEQYGIRVAETWKLGRKGIDDGALLLVAKDDRALRIEVGYGLEGVIPDAVAKRVIEEIILPRFKQGDFAGGIDAGVDALIGLVQGEPLPAPAPPAPGTDLLEQALPLALIFIFVVGGLLRAIFGRFLGASAAGGIAFFGAWLLLGSFVVGLVVALVVFLITLGGGGHIGHLGGGFGGRGGGGFGGGWSGGGGGFGGGGASGRW
nr:TPM domain-containing protein [Sulfuritortus calidifontis]